MQRELCQISLTRKELVFQQTFSLCCRAVGHGGQGHGLWSQLTNIWIPAHYFLVQPPGKSLPLTITTCLTGLFLGTETNLPNRAWHMLSAHRMLEAT
jgi:hypothetical protein